MNQILNFIIIIVQSTIASEEKKLRIITTCKPELKTSVLKFAVGATEEVFYVQSVKRTFQSITTAIVSSVAVRGHATMVGFSTCSLKCFRC